MVVAYRYNCFAAILFLINRVNCQERTLIDVQSDIPGNGWVVDCDGGYADLSTDIDCEEDNSGGIYIPPNQLNGEKGFWTQCHQYGCKLKYSVKPGDFLFKARVYQSGLQTEISFDGQRWDFVDGEEWVEIEEALGVEGKNEVSLRFSHFSPTSFTILDKIVINGDFDPPDDHTTEATTENDEKSTSEDASTTNQDIPSTTDFETSNTPFSTTTEDEDISSSVSDDPIGSSTECSTSSEDPAWTSTTDDYSSSSITDLSSSSTTDDSSMSSSTTDDSSSSTTDDLTSSTTDYSSSSTIDDSSSSTTTDFSSFSTTDDTITPSTDNPSTETDIATSSFPTSEDTSDSTTNSIPSTSSPFPIAPPVTSTEGPCSNPLCTSSIRPPTTEESPSSSGSGFLNGLWGKVLLSILGLVLFILLFGCCIRCICIRGGIMRRRKRKADDDTEEIISSNGSSSGKYSTQISSKAKGGSERELYLYMDRYPYLMNPSLESNKATSSKAKPPFPPPPVPSSSTNPFTSHVIYRESTPYMIYDDHSNRKYIATSPSSTDVMPNDHYYNDSHYHTNGLGPSPKTFEYFLRNEPYPN